MTTGMPDGTSRTADAADPIGPANPAAKPPAPRTVDAVVVGGGIAGLVAAHTLLADGLSPVVLEASDTCGGYLACGDVGPEGSPVVVDVGAESYASRSQAIAGLVRDLGLQAAEPSGLSAWGYVPVRPGRGAVSQTSNQSDRRTGSASDRGQRPHPGRGFPLPKAGVLGIPGHPWAADTRRALGVAGSLRASLDRVLPASRVDTSNLASLVRSRLGARVLDRLVVPVAGGVHSTDPALLAVDAVAPGLLAAYERTGSLTGAVRALRAQAPAGSAVRGLVGGMNQLVAALERAVESGVEAPSAEATSAGASGSVPLASTTQSIATHPGTAHTSTTRTTTHGEILRGTGARALRWGGDVWEVETTSGAVLRSARVVLAVGGHQAVALLAGGGTGAGAGTPLASAPLVDTRDAAPVRGTDIRLVTLLLRAPALGDAPRGTGALVAPGSDVVAKGSTHASAKWPWLRERLDAILGEDTHVVRLSYGRGGAAASTALAEAEATGTDAADAAYVEQSVRDVEALYGVDLPPDAVLSAVVTRWDDALSPPTPEHRERTSRLVSDVAALGGAGRPGLSVTGAWVAGTGLAAVVPHAQAAARASRIP